MREGFIYGDCSDEIIKQWDLYNTSTVYVNLNGTCQSDYAEDTTICVPNENTNEFEVTYSANTTTGKLQTEFTNDTTIIYVYNNTTSRPNDNNLWLCVANESGNWFYQSTCEGITPLGFSTFTAIDSGVFNDTGVHLENDNTIRFYLKMSNPSQNYYISNIPIPGIPPESETPTKSMAFLEV